MPNQNTSQLRVFELKAKWKDSELPQTLINRIKNELNINDNGGVSYKIETTFLFDALFGKVQHDYELDEESLYSKFQRATMEAFEKDSFYDPSIILDIFSEKCKKALKNQERFTLVTSINLPQNYTPKNRKIDGCSIRYSKALPRKYKESRRKIIEENKDLNISDYDRYTFVTISLSAANISSAYFKGMKIFDVIRALWEIDFVKSINSFAWPFSERYRAESTFHLGQVHTVHLRSGKIASDSVITGLWHEPTAKKRPLKKINGLHRMDSNLDKQLKKLKQNPYSSHMKDCLQNYISALDHDDKEHKFFKLNTTLEKILKADNTKTLIRRLSFFDPDKTLTKIIIENIRDSRNVSTHAGITPKNINMKNFQLCLYIDHLLKFFNSNPFRYKKLSDVISFISLPTEIHTIEEQIKKLNLVKEWIGHKS